MKGKQRCKILKEIRQQIADANDIEYITSECRHKGDCLGTCPKCEAELRYLERELEKRRRLGKTVVVAGLSALIATSTVGCDDWLDGRELGGDPLPPEGGYEQGLNGDIALPGVLPLPEEEIVEPTGDVALPEDFEGEIPDDEMMGDPVDPPPTEDIELGGDPLPDPSAVLEDIDPSLTADDLKNILIYGVTREGLYNSYGWAERFVSTDENGNDVYLCPLEGYDTMTVIYEQEDNGADFIVDVQFEEKKSDGVVVLPSDTLT